MKVGRGPQTWLKHELIAKAATPQVAVFATRAHRLGRGVLIDMHAGDGDGCIVADGQSHLFEPRTSAATSALAVRLATRYGLNLDVLLCESHPERRRVLVERYGPSVEVLRSYNRLLRRDLSRYGWTVVLNDPNGPSHQGVEVMQHIATAIPASDFVVVVNEGAIRRHGRVTDTSGDDRMAALRRRVAETAGRDQWMLDPYEWMHRLGKQHAACSRFLVKNNALHGRVYLLTNFIADGVYRSGCFDFSTRKAA